MSGVVPDWIVSRFGDAKISPVTAGWSHDQKYKIETATGSYLFRVSPADHYSRKQEEFAQVARLNQRTDAFPQAVEHGLSPDHKDCFVRYQWIEGTESLNVFPRLTDEQQYEHGVTAGKLLRMIHDLTQTKVVDSYAAISEKMAVRKQQMKDLQLEFEGYDQMLTFLDEKLHLLKNAPTSFQHGDFHLGNMLIDPAGRLRVIDFNRSNFGDPMDDYDRLFTFSRKESIPFARGQLMGYVGGSIPDRFFNHALCYIVMNCAFGLVWAQQFGEKEMAVQHQLITQIRDDFEGLSRTRPVWMVE